MPAAAPLTVAVCTFVKERADLLHNQVRGLARQTHRPDEYVVVSIDGAPAKGLLSGVTSAPVLVELAADSGELPASAARNAAAAASRCDVLVFLDPGCVPAPGLVARYLAAASADRILCGPVAQLPRHASPERVLFEPRTRALATFPSRQPLPEPGVTVYGQRPGEFRAGSFAIEAGTFDRLSGFDEAYRSAGIEDLDFATRAAEAGCRFAWIGGAEAIRQHPGVDVPTGAHLAELVRDARRFRSRWGRWPREDWFDHLRALGTVRWDPARDRLEALEPSLPHSTRVTHPDG